MKCAKCGADLKEGCLYCSVCGYEAQIAPDYSVLEDDYLRSILQQEGKEKPQQQTRTEPNKKNKKSKKIPIIIICCILVIGIISGITVKLYIDDKNANSYDYQMQMAEKELTDRNYEKALNYYKTALAILPGDIRVRLEMAKVYMDKQEYDSALVLCVEIIQLDKSNEEAYKNLIKIYEEKEDYDSITSLVDQVTDVKILQLFDDYIVTDPIISPSSGVYDETITVSMISMKNFEIYYTLDGTEPDMENGILYRDRDIVFDKAGSYEFSAVCVNEKGIYSDVVTRNYEIRFKAPDYAVVTPDGGRITEETQITITAEEGCSIYYTWEDEDPTELSAKYTEPIAIPEGNYVLSVLVVDDTTGLNSGVYRTNFIFYR